MPSLLNRFQRVVVLPLIVFLACFVIGLSWWTMQLQLGIVESDLNRTGSTTAENLAKLSLAAMERNDVDSLNDFVGLVRERETGISSISLLNSQGESMLSGGDEVSLPLDPLRQLRQRMQASATGDNETVEE